MSRKYRGSITVDVDIDELIDELSDKDVRQAFEDRFGAPAPRATAAFDLLEEVRAELTGGRISSALALLDSALVAQRISDDARQAAYQAAGRAH